MSYAIITGASKGIGKCIATELAQRGYDVLLVARSTDLLNSLAQSLSQEYAITAKALSVDMASADAAATIFDYCQQHQLSVSIIVNNAGYGLSGTFEKYAAAAHEAMLQVNIMSLTQLCALFIPQLKKQPQAYILNIASSAAYQAVPYLGAYAASKAYVLRFSRALYQEYKNSNLSVSCVCPGPTDTDFVNRALLGPKGMKAAAKVNMTPEQVAQIAVRAMFAKKPTTIVGWVNKLGAFLAWLLPNTIVERSAMSIYQ